MAKVRENFVQVMFAPLSVKVVVVGVSSILFFVINLFRYFCVFISLLLLSFHECELYILAIQWCVIVLCCQW